VDRCFVAKQKLIEQMLDEGYKLQVPNQFKWHESHKSEEDYISKLNMANYNLLQASLKKLTSPKEGYEMDSRDTT
jgi:hypothetical protein